MVGQFQTYRNRAQNTAMPSLLAEVSPLTEKNPVDMTPEVGEESHTRAFVVSAVHPVGSKPNVGEELLRNSAKTAHLFSARNKGENHER